MPTAVQKRGEAYRQNLDEAPGPARKRGGSATRLEVRRAPWRPLLCPVQALGQEFPTCWSAGRLPAAPGTHRGASCRRLTSTVSLICLELRSLLKS